MEMKYVSDIETGKKAILEKYPELKGSRFEADNSGWTNYAIKVDGKYLFRFPRNDDAYGAIAKESKILEILNQTLPCHIRVPKYIYRSLNTDHPFVGYELIEGRFLTKEVFDSLSSEEREAFLKSMAEFLNILHSVDYTALNLTIVDPIEWYGDLYKRVQKICFPHFDEELISATVKLFEDFFHDKTMHHYKPTLVHGDLSGDHILVTDDGVGIIDFGDLMVFDPAYDFIWAYFCSLNFYRELLSRYDGNKECHGNKDDYFEHRIRDFHLIRPPYDGIIYASETKDNELLERELKNLRENFNSHSKKSIC